MCEITENAVGDSLSGICDFLTAPRFQYDVIHLQSWAEISHIFEKTLLTKSVEVGYFETQLRSSGWI